MEGNTPGNMTEIPTHPKISSLELRVLNLSQNLQVKVKIIKRGRRGYIGKALGEVGTQPTLQNEEYGTRTPSPG